MTEREWLGCTDPKAMLAFLRDGGKLTDRKARLFAVACCRSIWPLLKDRRLRRAVEIAEKYADAEATDKQRDLACCQAVEAGTDLDDDNLADAGEHASKRDEPLFNASETAYLAAQAVGSATPDDKDPDAAMEAQHARQCGLLRDITGNPFLLPTLNPSWLTPNVVSLARTVNDERAFGRLPVLADTLEAAGCDNADILSHLREPGPHVRGCWAIDLLTGRS